MKCNLKVFFPLARQCSSLFVQISKFNSLRVVTVCYVILSLCMVQALNHTTPGNDDIHYNITKPRVFFVKDSVLKGSVRHKPRPLEASESFAGGERFCKTNLFAFLSGPWGRPHTNQKLSLDRRLSLRKLMIWKGATSKNKQINKQINNSEYHRVHNL